VEHQQEMAHGEPCTVEMQHESALCKLTVDYWQPNGQSHDWKFKMVAWL